MTHHQIRRGAYYDSVVLMQLQRALSALPGIQDAGVVMATPANLELLSANGFALADIVTTPDDLLIMVRAESDAVATKALDQIDALLARKRALSVDADYQHKSLAAAAQAMPTANWVLVSVPGRFAAQVAHEALDLGKHVFLYSNNVSLADEVALKQSARAKGLLVMGPDCGTAIINGIGLGFANRVRHVGVDDATGIGIVGASGTGLQAVTSEIHRLGGSITHAIGTGGRDLKAEVGGITALQALDMLAHDPATAVIAFISKPPSPEVAARLLDATRTIAKPVIIHFIGYPAPAQQLDNLYFAHNLRETAALAIRIKSQESSTKSQASRIENQDLASSSLDSWFLALGLLFVRGLFSGGTLAYESLLALQVVLTPIYSNSPIRPEQALPDARHSVGHCIIDMGEDEFTQGRLHPMMDYDLRLRRIRQEAADPNVGLILLDVVLGEGSHPDPASELAPVIAEVKAKRPTLEVVIIMIGTDNDAQGQQSQIARLSDAGARVFHSVDAAVGFVAQAYPSHFKNEYPPIALSSLTASPNGLTAINVGLSSFYDSLRTQGASVAHVDWRPPAAGNERLAGILARMKRKS
ncbi:MAG: acyl-CoA synthetase FdrA [Chloroflexi bacterium]|nr:acyl-CoA synthetase FdrA [Chloroflexota bacterium]